MGTRSCIIIKVRENDKGKTLKFNEKSLPVELKDWSLKDPTTGKVWRDETGKNKCMPVTLGENYIGIYCHWDGYVKGGVGDALKEAFNDYEKAINLAVGGFCSSVAEDGVKHYANRKGEKWETVKPLQGKTQKSIFEQIWDAEYIYLFDEERGGWLYKPAHGCNKRGFIAY